MAAAKSTDTAPLAPAEPARYRVVQPSYIGEAMRQEGEVVFYDGEPGENLEPLNDAATAAKAAARPPGIGPGHPQFVRELIRRDKQGEPMGLPGGGVADPDAKG